MRRPSRALLPPARSATAASARYRSRPSQRPEDALALPRRAAPGVAARVPEHAATPALADGRRIAVPSHAQRQRTATLENDARKPMDEERARCGREVVERGGEGEEERRRGGGIGRRPEG